MKRITKDKSNKTKNENGEKQKHVTRSTKNIIQLKDAELKPGTSNSEPLKNKTSNKSRKGKISLTKKKPESCEIKTETLTEIKQELPEELEQEPSEELEQEPEDKKPDLSAFKFSPKSKLVSQKLQEVKREHIKVEYDSSKVIKNEGNAYLEDPKQEVDSKKSKWEPPNWRKVLENLQEMRKNQDAPVDSMGSHKCMDESAPAKTIRFQALISLMLSSQTKDQVTHAAMQKLKAHGLTVENIVDTSDETLGQLIYPVGFWKTKVKYIKKTCQILKEQYDGDIPNTVQDLCKLIGVGPKMAHLCMKTAWGEVTGIGVDTHVHRITNRLGWVRATKTPEATRKELEGWLPQELWSEVNSLLVGFGQQICQPIKPQCATCLNHELCPFGRSNLRGKLK